MLHVAIVDHHPAVRSALQTGIDAQGAITVVGAVADRLELWPLLEATRPEVVVLGQPARDHATEVCRRIRTKYVGSRVVLYTSSSVTVSAVLAGAHALVDRTEDFETLVDAIWTVASGGRMVPAPTPDMRRDAAKRLAGTDQAILAMLLAGTSIGDVGTVTGLSRRDLEARRAAIIATLAGRRVALETDPLLAA